LHIAIGVIDAADSYMQGLRELTEKHGILLIADEIQTGMGRTGKMFACQHTGITPDIMTLGKGIGGGVPLAALLALDTACCFAHGDQGGTFNGNPLMTAAGLAVWRELSKPGFLDGVVAAGAYLSQGLEALSSKFGLGAVRGRGLLLALDLKAPLGGDIAAAALAAGLLLNAPRPDSLRFMPALNIAEVEIRQILVILDEVMAQIMSRAA
jgi:acetylornithine/N-succinyldiaminopimelate aminotransferase